ARSEGSMSSTSASMIWASSRKKLRRATSRFLIRASWLARSVRTQSLSESSADTTLRPARSKPISSPPAPLNKETTWPFRFCRTCILDTEPYGAELQREHLLDGFGGLGRFLMFPNTDHSPALSAKPPIRVLITATRAI